jgi:hypothetical protein
MQRFKSVGIAQKFLASRDGAWCIPTFGFAQPTYEPRLPTWDKELRSTRLNLLAEPRSDRELASDNPPINR